MKKLIHLYQYRVEHFGSMGDDYNGAFLMKMNGQWYNVIASNGGGWEHVSVSGKKKPPNWNTMCIIKGLFFEDNEVVMQLHPAKVDHINLHTNCLHLWRPIEQKIPLPPIEFV